MLFTKHAPAIPTGIYNNHEINMLHLIYDILNVPAVDKTTIIRLDIENRNVTTEIADPTKTSLLLIITAAITAPQNIGKYSEI